KRLALVAISLVIGFAVTFFVVTVDFQLGPIHLVIAGTTIEQYGIWYTSFTTLAIACAVGVWLDKFMGTEILPK
ncbi:MAG TPA: hypothetical protein VEC93_17890, partial [Anaerolineae bacterium]|nr:hypothetical protein [Anaerolineae bacterium]